MVLDILALQNEERSADHGRQEKSMRPNRHRPAQPGNRRKRPPGDDHQPVHRITAH